MADEKYLGSQRVSEFWLAIKSYVVTKISSALTDYVTDEGVVTAITIALENYVRDEDMRSAIQKALENYMTSDEVTRAIEDAIGEVIGITFKIVDNLPAIGESNVIYLIPSDAPGDKNIKDEYMLIDGNWEKIGSTSANLSNYWSKDELREMTKEELEAILV